MTHTITLTRTFETHNGGQMSVEFVIDSETVTVTGQGFDPCIIGWNWITDVESLVGNLGDWPVFVFKQLCETLDHINQNKTGYLAVL